MEQYGFTDRQPHCGRMRSDLLVFANVIFIRVFRRHQGPDLRDLFLANVEHSCALRCVDPFVQRSSEVIAAEISLFEIELSERMRAVDDRFYPTLSSHFADRLY